MNNIFRNWHTTLFGVSTIIGGIALYIQGNTTEAVVAILGGIGLILGKDANKTGVSK